eukprot:scaffold239310_cov19-Tisochrysis_lutea.AAC.2
MIKNAPYGATANCSYSTFIDGFHTRSMPKGLLDRLEMHDHAWMGMYCKEVQLRTVERVQLPRQCSCEHAQ